MGATGSTPRPDEGSTAAATLNDNNLASHGRLLADKHRLPASVDVVVLGGGIQSLIYSIHTRKLELARQISTKDTDFTISLSTTNLKLPMPLSTTSITILESCNSPSYKIGGSTLMVFGLWLKTVGLEFPLLSRLFGPKDGIAFYYFTPTGDPEQYGIFIANGPPGDFVPTLQIERKISELLLTMYAQRLGIQVLYGHEVDVHQTQISDEGSILKVRNMNTGEDGEVQARLLIDATGRFHRFTSCESRIERFKTFNTHAFWAYFEEIGDESDIPLNFYESCNTNHLCIPEGWAWVIRLPSWEGSSIPNLMMMINHLLDLNEKRIPADKYPSVSQLVKTFSLKFRWIVSIGFALRSDVTYPEDLSSYGHCEAQSKFNWIVRRYPKIQALRSKHILLHDLYGPDTTWFMRKNLTYRCPIVARQSWAAIGDAVGFTNPLYSPGINANMGTSIFAAEMTQAYLTAPDAKARQEVLNGYSAFCAPRIKNLNLMNIFNYILMRSPELSPLGPLWQYLCGTGNANFQGARKYDLGSVHELLTTWDWGANEGEYIRFASLVTELLDGPPDEVLTAEEIQAIKTLSAERLKAAVATGKYKGRWGGSLRFYDDDLNHSEEKTGRDILARRCNSCKNWKMLRPDVLKCAFCGHKHTVEESTKVLFAEKDS